MAGFHGIPALILLSAHLFFLIRGILLSRREEEPKPWDRWARSLAQGLLLPVILTGFFLTGGNTADLTGAEAFLRWGHRLAGLAPVAAILIFTLFRGLRRRFPAALPAVNGLFLSGAFISGCLIFFS